MRNLVVVEHTLAKSKSILPLAASAWDTSAENELICAYGPSTGDPVIEVWRVTISPSKPGSVSEGRLLASWDAPSPLPDTVPTDRIICLQYFAHSDCCVLVLAGGDIVVVRENPLPGQEKIEIVGSVDAGIDAAAWAPDGELLAIATRAGTFLYMTAAYECVSNVTFSADDAKLSKQVSVGWGKRETQFQGKRARALRDPTVPEYVDEGRRSTHDNDEVRISWRGDAAYVAVSSAGTPYRMIRIFSRGGELEGVSEATDGLESALSWRPLGNLIAGVQRRASGELFVVFFERNGLRHGEFQLRMSEEDADKWGTHIALHWNADSSVLAVAFADRIQLWTMGNYHYYLKQEIFPAAQLEHESACQVVWHPENALRMLSFSRCFPQSGDAVGIQAYSVDVEILHFVSDIISGSANPPNDIGGTAVIDGRLLRYSPLRFANVPPPMALHEIYLESNAKSSAIREDNTELAILHKVSISIIRDAEPDAVISDPVLQDTIKLPKGEAQVASHVCYSGTNGPFVGIFDLAKDLYIIYNCATKTQMQIPCISGPVRLFGDLDGNAICVCNGSQVSLYSALPQAWLKSESIACEFVCDFPSAVTFVHVIRLEGSTIAFGLTSSGTLFANDKTLVRNCTSFILTKAHLILTTANHLLKFIHIVPEGELDVPADEPEKDERCRSIERGAKLVNVMPTASSVVLQMPRGNLETIYPRALVLAAVRRFVDAKDYKAAFLACRNQRVDMNILHDYAPEQFLENIDIFVGQLKKPEYIDLFLSHLSPDDSAQTIYKETLPGKRTADVSKGDVDDFNSVIAASNPSKVNRICDAFLAFFKTQNPTSIQNTITAHLCKIPPDIEAGLREIARLGNDTGATETAVEHICFLTDANRIYDAALGLYDLQMALLVAQQSQKDPREYLPYLQRLQKLPQLRRQYAINHDLGRHAKALYDLHDLEDFEAALAYAQKHEIYSHALEAYKYEEAHYDSVLRAYADHLTSKNQHREAATAYEGLGDYAAASEAFRAVNMWEESLSCASLVPVSAEDLTLLAQNLADSLEEAKDFLATGHIYRDYLHQIPSAAQFLCKAYHFSEAISLVALHGEKALLSSVIDQGLVEAAATLTEMLTECKAQISAQVPRLRDLRKIKATDPLAFFEGAEGPDIPDNISLAPSAASTSGNTFMTRYTNRTGTIGSSATRKTSKNKRREERKRARGKKGSVYEEEYLVNSVGRLIERVNSIGEDVRRTVEACLRRAKRQQAKALEVVMKEVVDACQGCVDEVYETGTTGGKTLQGQTEVSQRPGGPEGVLWDSLTEHSRRIAPTIKAFEENVLLREV